MGMNDDLNYLRKNLPARMASSGGAAARALEQFAADAGLASVPKLATIARDEALRTKLEEWIGAGHSVPGLLIVPAASLPATKERPAFNGRLARGGDGWILLGAMELGPVPEARP
jgi:hypothetical protein